jgi:archaellum component FlaC
MERNTMTSILTLLLAIALTAGVLSAQEGHKRTDRLIKRAEDTTKEIESTKQQLQKSLILYNSIIDGKAENPRKSYNDLGKSIERCEKKVEDVGKRVESMELEAHNFFAEWTQSLEQITNENLSERSQQRLNDTRVRYGDILRSGRSAGAEFDTFMADLHDQVVYLGFDLNPSAVASLKEDSVKLNEHAGVLFKKIDEVVAAIGEYIKSIQPE